MQIFYGSIGVDTNNSVELEGMLLGIKVVIRNGWLSTVVEGDSSIRVQMTKHLSNGKSTEKVSLSWRLASRLVALCILIMVHTMISFQHVKRDANKVADMLANIGTNGNGAHRMGRLEEFEVEPWVPRC